ncbi:PhnA domain-containing protein [Sulfurimonas sp. SAG-AH-194-I05]|nr:alkylphosphonate utilization protein [Sulfurimonas sp. SAG-AH-194-I05]MDF1875729.1 PhnA domain-containing protein [Sulfurimonas sp. SAG-AH-194-I05]
MSRSSVCELCGSSEAVSLTEVSPSDASEEQSIYLCANCKGQIECGELDETHFNCLNDSMWSEIPAVAVMSYRLLHMLGRQDLVDMMYMEETTKSWADAGLSSEEKLVYKDANGVILQAGDTVVITKDLDVKGTGFTAKRGTAVRNIGLVHNDVEHIEGRVNGVKIHILTKFLKKS